MPNNRDELRLTLDHPPDGVDADAFVDILVTTIAVLKEINKNVSPFGSPGIRWLVSDAGHNSPFYATLRGTDEPKGAKFSPEVIETFVEGVSRLRSGETSPPRFNETALKLTNRMSRNFARGVLGVEFSSNGHKAKFDKTVAKNANKAAIVLEHQRVKKSGEYHEYGTIEGHLRDLMEQHDNDKMVIIDRITGKQTPCYIRDPEVEQQARAAWKHRVQVSGRITVDGFNGDYLRMDVEEIVEMPGREKLPQLEDILGIDITGGIESSEYIRGLRDAE